MQFKKMLVLGLFTVGLCSLPTFAAARLLNDMQGCQSVLDFVVEKIDAKPPHATAEELAAMKSALVDYRQAIQRQVVEPGLMAAASGDEAQAQEWQEKVDEYLAARVANYHKRFPQPKLFGDFALLINDCAQKWLPKGVDVDPLRNALMSIMTIGGRK